MPKVTKGKPAVLLAPMEGVTEAPMRALLTEVGGYSFCVSEFFRVSQSVPFAKVLRHHTPELDHQSKTRSGTPVAFQILGGDAEKLALCALRATEAGARSIDLNFGCPAPTVNRHDGGATLLKFPDRIELIIETVRAAVPKEIPVSAKLRLGWDDPSAIHENSARAEKAGASWITIHGRTKLQGYIPPAYWGPIGEVQKRLSIPVIANGEIWTLEDFRRCQEQTRCEHFMLGRGALADPRLALQISKELGIHENQPGSPFVTLEKVEWPELLLRFVEVSQPYIPNQRYTIARIKQWARMISIVNHLPWFEPIKRLQNLEEIIEVVRKSEGPTPKSRPIHS